MILILVHSGPHNGRKKFCRTLANMFRTSEHVVKIYNEYDSFAFETQDVCIIYGLDVFRRDWHNYMQAGIVLEWNGESVLMHQLRKAEHTSDTNIIHSIIHTHQKNSNMVQDCSGRNHLKTMSFLPVLYDPEAQQAQFQKICRGIMAMCV